MLATWFDETEKDAIMQVRLPFTPCLDSWKWRLNLQEDFTIKEAYHNSAHKGITNDKELWKTIWQVSTSNRDKLMLWRIAAKVIPTRENIQRRITNTDMRCPTCDHNMESNIHCFFLCLLAKGMWFNILGLRVDEVQLSNLQQWLLFLFKRHASEVWNGWEIGKMTAIILKQIWKARNESWTTTSHRNDPHRMLMLINQSIEAAELSAIELAIKIARTQEWRNLVVESDCQKVVKAYNKPHMANWQWQSRAEAIKLWLVENSNCSITFVKRTLNVTAHMVANFARVEQFNNVLELESLPTVIKRAVDLDSD